MIFKLVSIAIHREERPSIRTKRKTFPLRRGEFVGDDDAIDAFYWWAKKQFGEGPVGPKPRKATARRAEERRNGNQLRPKGRSF